MDLDVFFAGTAGSVPTARRGLPALLVRRGGDRLLFDCGEGTQRQLVRSVGLPELDDVFITHYHVDHWLGLPGMLKTFDLRGRERPLAVHGPPGLDGRHAAAAPRLRRLSYELDLVELESGEAVRRDGYSVAAFAVEHRVTAYGYALWEDERPGRFDAELAERLGVTPGPDFGRLQDGETVGGVAPEQVLGPPRRRAQDRRVRATRRPCEALDPGGERRRPARARGDVRRRGGRARARTSHSTASQAAAAPAEAGVRMLALTHLSTRYGGRELRDEARAVFANTVVPHDFDAIELPFPERGEPSLVRWEEAVRT